MATSVVNDLNLSEFKHPDIYSEFRNGNFTVNKTTKPFSSIGIDQAHEQNNKLVKIDGGAVNILLSDSTALMKWMVGGPEISEMVQSFRSDQICEAVLQYRHEDRKIRLKKKLERMLSRREMF